MKKIILGLIAIIGILLIIGCDTQEFKSSQEGRGNQEGRQLNQNNKEELNQHTEENIDSFPKEEISLDEIEALSLTINDEYKAEAIYQKVLDKFGDVKPFSNIINAEKKHSNSLKEIYQKYDLTIPVNDWSDKVPEFDSIEEACQAGVEAEIENVALYDELFAKVDNQDIIAVFTSLRDASQDKHLPAFQRCVAR